jgi:Uma2 family endonuclease
VPEAFLTEPPITIAAFDAFLDAQQDDDSLWEPVAGRIVAMTNPTEDDGQIASNIGAPLKLAVDPKWCRAYQGGIRVRHSDDSSGQDKPQQIYFGVDLTNVRRLAR